MNLDKIRIKTIKKNSFIIFFKWNVQKEDNNDDKNVKNRNNKTNLLKRRNENYYHKMYFSLLMS